MVELSNFSGVLEILELASAPLHFETHLRADVQKRVQPCTWKHDSLFCECGLA